MHNLQYILRLKFFKIFSTIWIYERVLLFHFHSFVKKFFKRFFRWHYFFLTSRITCKWVKAFQLFLPLIGFYFFPEKTKFCVYFCLNQFISFKKLYINTPRMKLPLDLEQKWPYLKVLDFISDLFYSYNNQSWKVKTNAKAPIQNQLFPAVQFNLQKK